MLEERAHQAGVIADLGKLRAHAFLELLARLQRPACVAGALGVAPDELIGIEIGCVARQKAQRELAPGGGHVVTVQTRPFFNISQGRVLSSHTEPATRRLDNDDRSIDTNHRQQAKPAQRQRMARADPGIFAQQRDAHPIL